MLVQHRMTPNPVTVTPETSFSDAFRQMREVGVRYLPVVDKKGRLIGIVTQKDLLHASPSSATTLSVFEINYLLTTVQVREVMSCPVITVVEDTPVEEAAKVMVQNGIGCLPVVRDDDRVVGIITETDIFKAFVEILGRGEAELRITLQAPDRPGELARLARVIADLGGNICSSASFDSREAGAVFFTMRLTGVREDVLVPALKQAGEQVVHVCSVAPKRG